MRVECENLYDSYRPGIKPCPVRAILLDKDGTLIEYAGPNSQGVRLTKATMFEERVRPIPEVVEFAESARAMGLRVGLLTGDSREATDETLERLHLVDLFDATVAAGESRGKPHPSAFKNLARLLGVPVASCVMVGDDLFKDVQGAQKAGMRTIMVPGGTFRMPPWEKPPQPHLSLRNRKDLTLEKILPL